LYVAHYDFLKLFPLYLTGDFSAGIET
jgi:hypothetical protein